MTNNNAPKCRRKESPLPIKNIRGDSKYGPMLKYAEKIKDKVGRAEIIKMARYEYDGLVGRRRRSAIKVDFIGPFW